MNEAVETAFSLEDRVGHRPRSDRRQRPLPARSTGWSPTRPRSPPRPTDADVALRPGEAVALASAARFRLDRTALQAEQVARLAGAAPAAPAAPAVPVPRPRSARASSTSWPGRCWARSRPWPGCRNDGPVQRLRGRRRAASDGHDALVDLVAERSIIVCCGSGGVGKTTTAAVVALEGARLGRKTVVVTIDPAKRLADALGLRGPDRHAEPHRRRLARRAVGHDARHQVDVRRAGRRSTPPAPSRASGSSPTASTGTSPAPCRARRSTWRWRSSTSCTTRPTSTSWWSTRRRRRHALDFLDAPRRLSRFLDHRLFRLLIVAQPGHRQGGQRGRPDLPAHRVAGRRRRRGRRRRGVLPGLRGHGGGVPAAGGRVNELLAADGTAFVLVASPRRDTVEEAHFFAERLGEAGIAVRGLVVNRVHPAFGLGADGWR